MMSQFDTYSFQTLNDTFDYREENSADPSHKMQWMTLWKVTHWRSSCAQLPWYAEYMLHGGRTGYHYKRRSITAWAWAITHPHTLEDGGSLNLKARKYRTSGWQIRHSIESLSGGLTLLIFSVFGTNQNGACSTNLRVACHGQACALRSKGLKNEKPWRYYEFTVRMQEVVALH